MKKIALVAALSLAASTAFAGGTHEVMVTPAVAVTETMHSSSGAGLIVPLLILLVVAAVVSHN